MLLLKYHLITTNFRAGYVPVLYGGLDDNDTQDPTPPPPTQLKRPYMVQLSGSSTAVRSSQSDKPSGLASTSELKTKGTRDHSDEADEPIKGNTDESDEDLSGEDLSGEHENNEDNGDTGPRLATVRAFAAGNYIQIMTTSQRQDISRLG